MLFSSTRTPFDFFAPARGVRDTLLADLAMRNQKGEVQKGGRCTGLTMSGEKLATSATVPATSDSPVRLDCREGARTHDFRALGCPRRRVATLHQLLTIRAG